MPDYEKVYFELFNAVTTAVHQLQSAQRDSENAYIGSDDQPPAFWLCREDKKPGADQ